MNLPFAAAWSCKTQWSLKQCQMRRMASLNFLPDPWCVLAVQVKGFISRRMLCAFSTAFKGISSSMGNLDWTLSVIRCCKAYTCYVQSPSRKWAKGNLNIMNCKSKKQAPGYGLGALSWLSTLQVWMSWSLGCLLFEDLKVYAAYRTCKQYMQLCSSATR